MYAYYTPERKVEYSETYNGHIGCKPHISFEAAYFDDIKTFLKEREANLEVAFFSLMIANRAAIERECDLEAARMQFASGEIKKYKDQWQALKVYLEENREYLLHEEDDYITGKFSLLTEFAIEFEYCTFSLDCFLAVEWLT
jgi:hypothetical protein